MAETQQKQQTKRRQRKKPSNTATEVVATRLNKSEETKFHGLNLSLGENESLAVGGKSEGKQARIWQYLDMHDRVFYIVGHGTKNQYDDLDTAAQNLYKLLVSEGEKIQNAGSLGSLETWQDKMLLVYGGDPNGKHDDVGKLIARVATRLKSVKVLAVQCDHWMDGALKGTSSYDHVSAFYFYPTKFETEEKKNILYGGYITSDTEELEPVGTTAFMAQVVDLWDGMIVIGGGEIAKKELEYFYSLAQKGGPSKRVFGIKARTKSAPKADKRKELILPARRSRRIVSDEEKYGVAWCAFDRMVKEEKLATDGNPIALGGEGELHWYQPHKG